MIVSSYYYVLNDFLTVFECILCLIIEVILNNTNRGVQLMNGSNMHLYSSEIKIKSEGGAASPVVYH